MLRIPASKHPLSLVVLCCAVLTSPVLAQDVDFSRDVRPIIAANCFACHGPDEKTREADLRLDSFEGATRDLGDYQAIVPGEATKSELIARIGSDDESAVMPPPESGHKLSKAEIDILTRWINSGAEYAAHWSFTKPARPELPDNDLLPPIDRLIRNELTKAGLKPSAPADRYQLIRRVSLDLTGLPPTLEQVDAFVNDESNDAYEKVVDRLLASEDYGERWARTWLDLARYADTRGYEKDNPREIWRYRDWVIEAFNADMPYDKFSIEQLAGDLLPNATDDQRLATAFHRNTLTNEEGGTDDEEFRVAAVKDRVDTTMQVWMGLTMGCARCHSHKYDPISQQEYYQFFAFFNQTEDNDREAPLMASPTNEQTAKIAGHQAKINQLRASLDAEVPGFDAAYEQWKREKAATPDWTSLKLADSISANGVSFNQNEDDVIVAGGERPEKDVWTLTFELPKTKSTALQIETFTRATSRSTWEDLNFVISELSVQSVTGEVKTELKLAKPRADFSQQNWPVAKAIDGDPETGWAVSPKIGEPHVAIFSFEEPFKFDGPARLQVTLDQNYGQKLVLAAIRISFSGTEPEKLIPVVDSMSRDEFRKIFPATRKILGALKSSEKDLAAIRGKVSNTPVMRELAENKRRVTRIHNRGNFLDQTEEVTPAVPVSFGSLPPENPESPKSSLDRLAVAKWIMDDENPLTARVMANRIWARLFGIGIVETEEDFGTQGMPPSNQLLLDWLAVEFRENGWSIKKLLKTIVLSETYRQSSQVSESSLAQDPNNRLISRGPRFRLSAEMIRDQALAASGLLTREIGGPSVMPPQPTGVWKSTYSDKKWINAEGPDRYRRGIYTYWKRTSPYPAMTSFDAGSGEVCLVRRVRTNTPLQALITLNDPAYVEAAGALARRIQRDGVEVGFRSILVRPPSQKELARLRKLYDETRAEFENDTNSAREFVIAAGLPADEPDAELAAWITVASVLLNLDETLMKP